MKKFIITGAFALVLLFTINGINHNIKTSTIQNQDTFAAEATSQMPETDTDYAYEPSEGYNLNSKDTSPEQPSQPSPAAPTPKSTPKATPKSTLKATPKSTPAPKATSGTATAIIATAKSYIGVPYAWGGSSPSGFDCSGFINYVYNKHGISLPRVTSEQFKVGTSVSKSNLIPGDLVFFETYKLGASHVGIYIGNNQFVHASSGAGKVMISDLTSTYYTQHYYGAKRVIK